MRGALGVSVVGVRLKMEIFLSGSLDARMIVTMLGVPPEPIRFGDAGRGARCSVGRKLSWQVNRSNYKPRECAVGVFVSETKGNSRH